MSLLAAVLPAVIGAVSSLAGGLMSQSFGESNASEAAHLSEYHMAQQFELNKLAYMNRYQWMTEDLKRAGLNPILAASGGFNVSGAPTVSMAQSYQAPTPQFDMAASARDVADAYFYGQKEDTARKEMESMDVGMSKTRAEIENIGAQTVSVLQGVQESVSRIALQRSQEGLNKAQEQVAVADFQRVLKDIEVKTQEVRTSVELMKKYVKDQNLSVAATATEYARQGELRELARKAREDTKYIMDQRANIVNQGEKLKAIGDVYRTPVGRGLAAIGEFIKQISPFSLDFGGK